MARLFYSQFASAAAPQVENKASQINKVCLFIAHEEDLILVVRHHAKDGSVSIEPAGGKIDPKADGEIETHEEALIREAEQELGITIKPNHMLHIENHPYTHKPVAYYACDHISGTPYNKASDEHLGVIGIPLGNIESYEDLKREALFMAQEIVDETSLGPKLSRSIEFRVPQQAVMAFIEDIMDVPQSSFRKIADENSLNLAKPA